MSAAAVDMLPPSDRWPDITATPDVLTACFDGYRSSFAMACSLEGSSHDRQVGMLFDCAELCRAVAERGLRRPVPADLISACARACRIGASICRQYDDQGAVECAETCHECAEACAALAGD